MKLENQVVSLELAKKLKELGVKQESLFWWVKEYGYSIMDGANTIDTEEWGVVYADNLNDTISKQKGEHISALTVAELGEMMNIELTDANEGESFTIKLSSAIDFWCVSFGNDDTDITPQFEDASMADALAKMLIYLISNNLITI